MPHPETSVNYNGMVIIRLQVKFKKDNIYWKWTTFALTGVWLFMLFIKLQNYSLYISCSPANRHTGVNLNLTFTGLNSNLSKEMKQKSSTSFKFYTFEWIKQILGSKMDISKCILTTKFGINKRHLVYFLQIAISSQLLTCRDVHLQKQ